MQGLRGETRGLLFDGYEHSDSYHLMGAKTDAMLPASVTGGLGSSLDALATGTYGDRNSAKPWHPDNPLFWFGMLAAVTFGLIGASSQLRVGSVRAGVKAGKT